MALDNYANLKAAIQRWSDRHELSQDELDECILMTESQINKELRIRENESLVTDTLSTSVRTLALPTLFNELRRIDIVDNGYHYPLKYAIPDAMQVWDIAGRPTIYTLTSQFEFNRLPSEAFTVEISYYKSITALSSSNTTNSVLTKYPNIYLYGCVSQACLHGEDFQKSDIFKAKFNEEIDMANRRENKGRYGPGARMTPQTATP